MNLQDFKIKSDRTIKQALQQINQDSLAKYVTLFAVDENDKLIGTITDGDIRRALLNDLELDANLEEVINRSCYFMYEDEKDLQKMREIKDKSIQIIPVVSSDRTLKSIVDLREQFSFLPIEVAIMAGGLGSRLRPLTLETPKPLLKIGSRPVMEWNIERLRKFGVQKFHISINYLGQKIKDYIASTEYGHQVDYIEEPKPLGTIGSLKYAEKEIQRDVILLMNSDLITNVDYEDFYHAFISSGADMGLVSIPYEVKIPYAVLETEGNAVKSFKEKPTYTYYSNGGIYFLKRSLLDMIPEGEFYNSTDLMEKLQKEGKKVMHYAHLEYWLDIGKMEDFEKAQRDIKQLKLLS